MKSLLTFLATIVIIIVYIINGFGGLIGGGWLLYLGKWQLVIAGIISDFAFVFLFGLLMITINSLFIKPAINLAEKGSTFLMVLVLLISSLIIIGIATYWTLIVFGLLFRIGVSSGQNLIPYMMWAYSIAVGPFTYLAYKETEGSPEGGQSSMVVTSFLCIGSLLMLLLYLFTTISLGDINLIFTGFMFLGWLVMIAASMELIKEVAVYRKLEEHNIDTQTAVFTNAQTAEDYKNSGNAKYNEGNFKGAIQDYNKAIEINPFYADAYNNRGIAKFDLGDKTGAIQDYNKAIEINPNHAVSYYNRGNSKSDLGDKTGAIQDYKKATEINPNINPNKE